MKENFTSINVILDESGSMWDLKEDTIGGFNQFLEEQRKISGEVVLTLCKFNTDHTLVYNVVRLEDIKNLEDSSYVPNGGTALLDALGFTIDSVGKKLSDMSEAERPSKVLFLIITDGEDNSSKTFSIEDIRNKVKHQQDVYSWEFVFMGANLDAITVGSSIGILNSNTVSYNTTPEEIRTLYGNISRSVESFRSNESNKKGFFS